MEKTHRESKSSNENKKAFVLATNFYKIGIKFSIVLLIFSIPFLAIDNPHLTTSIKFLIVGFAIIPFLLGWMIFNQTTKLKRHPLTELLCVALNLLSETYLWMAVGLTVGGLGIALIANGYGYVSNLQWIAGDIGWFFTLILGIILLPITYFLGPLAQGIQTSDWSNFGIIWMGNLICLLGFYLGDKSGHKHLNIFRKHEAIKEKLKRNYKLSV